MADRIGSAIESESEDEAARGGGLLAGAGQPAAARLDTACRFADPDGAFRLLAEAHRGLSEADSADLNARLVLILANHIGDAGVLAEAIALARRAGAGGEAGE